MKHLKGYYQNRKRLKQLEYDDKEYQPTVEACWEWFHILNEQIRSEEHTSELQSH